MTGLNVCSPMNRIHIQTMNNIYIIIEGKSRYTIYIYSHDRIIRDSNHGICILMFEQWSNNDRLYVIDFFSKTVNHQIITNQIFAIYKYIYSILDIIFSFYVYTMCIQFNASVYNLILRNQYRYDTLFILFCMHKRNGVDQSAEPGREFTHIS